MMFDVIMRYNAKIDEYYDLVKKRAGSGMIAHVAPMRKVTTMLYRMLKTKQQKQALLP